MLLADTIIDGIQVYFDCALGNILLYEFEQEQYAEVQDKYWATQDIVIGTEKDMSDIYGAEHLLQLLGEFHVSSFILKNTFFILLWATVKLPEIVATMRIDEESMQIITEYINELLK